MALQAGLWCYADQAGAAAAACASMTPTTRADGGNVVTTSCVGVNTADELVIRVAATPVGAPGSAVIQDHAHPVAFGACQWPDVTDAGLSLFAALLVCGVIVWTGKTIVGYMNWGAGYRD